MLRSNLQDRGLWLPKVHVDRWSEQYILYLRDSDLRFHTGSDRSTLDSMVGSSRSSNRHVLSWRLLPYRARCKYRQRRMGHCCYGDGVSIHLYIRRYLAHGSVAISRGDFSSHGPRKGKRMGRSRLEFRERVCIPDFDKPHVNSFRSLTLALPYVFDALGEKTMHIFGAVNIISIPIGELTLGVLVYQAGNMLELWRSLLTSRLVWALYPESNQRTLEEIDLLFAADSPWAWTAESNFQALKMANAQFGLAKDAGPEYDAEKALDTGDQPKSVESKNQG